jgi:hypothetical protein
MPLDIVPAGNERGFRTISEIPITNTQTGGYTYRIHGHTPKPTPTDGYHITATIDLDAHGGAVVTKLVIEPSSVIREGDSHRPRQPDELRQTPVTTTALGLVKFTEIFSRIEELETKLLKALAEERPELQAAGVQFETARAAVEERLRRLSRRGPRSSNDAKHARHAEQVLDSMSQGHRYQPRLRELYPQDWTLSDDGIKKRIRRLRDNGWLHRDYGKPGPTLTEWRDEHGPDRWAKENT